MSTNLKPLASAILKSGIIGPEVLVEFRKWGFPFEEDPSTTFSTPTDVVESLEAALQSEGLVIERVTDIDVTKQYLGTTKVGTLHVEIEGEVADFPIPYGRTPMGEYIIPWRGDNVTSEMTNGLTYLRTDGGDIFFSSVRDFFFGETKAFMVCSASIVVS